MANHKSAEKRARQTERRTAANSARRSRVRTSIKKVEDAIKSGEPELIASPAGSAGFAPAGSVPGGTPGGPSGGASGRIRVCISADASDRYDEPTGLPARLLVRAISISPV